MQTHRNRKPRILPVVNHQTKTMDRTRINFTKRWVVVEIATFFFALVDLLLFLDNSICFLCRFWCVNVSTLNLTTHDSVLRFSNKKHQNLSLKFSLLSLNFPKCFDTWKIVLKHFFIFSYLSSISLTSHCLCNNCCCNVIRKTFLGLSKPLQSDCVCMIKVRNVMLTDILVEDGLAVSCRKNFHFLYGATCFVVQFSWASFLVFVFKKTFRKFNFVWNVWLQIFFCLTLNFR